MGARIVVTGAAGFIGSHTVDLLLAAGHKVWGIDSLRTGKRANLSGAQLLPAFELHVFDVLDEPRLNALMRAVQPDAIIHLAALVSVPESIANPELNHRLNFVATKLVADAAIRSGACRMIFASSAAVYGDAGQCRILETQEPNPLSPYGASKLASEDLLTKVAAARDIEVRYLRYFNVYGPRQDPCSSYSGVISILCRHAARGTAPVIFGNGTQTRDFISVHDVARANLLAATLPETGSGIVNICTGVPTSIGGLWNVICAERGISLPPRHEDARAGDILHSYGSPDRAMQELGFRAAIDLSRGVRDLLAL